MIFLVLFVVIFALCVLKVATEDRKNRPGAYAAKASARRLRRLRAGWDPEASRVNRDALTARTAGLTDAQMFEVTAFMLGTLSGDVAPAVWARALARVPVPCSATWQVGTRTRRCAQQEGHAGPHKA